MSYTFRGSCLLPLHDEMENFDANYNAKYFLQMEPDPTLEHVPFFFNNLVLLKAVVPYWSNTPIMSIMGRSTL